MSDLTTYRLDDGVATITMDDGKANALSTAMLDELGAAFERAEADEAIVVLTGRERTFSGGFDLRCEPERWPEMVGGGARLAQRIMSFPHPVVAACTGNAVAMAGFVLLSCDVRVGVAGDFRIGLNEVAIGLAMPWFAIAISRHRLAPAYFDRCCVTGVLLDPEEARAAGFLDRLVAPAELPAAAREAAGALAGIDRAAHAATKLRVRERALAELREGIARMGGALGEW